MEDNDSAKTNLRLIRHGGSQCVYGSNVMIVTIEYQLELRFLWGWRPKNPIYA